MRSKLLLLVAIIQLSIGETYGQLENWNINVRARSLLYLAQGGGAAGNFDYKKAKKTLCFDLYFANNSQLQDTAYRRHLVQRIRNGIEYFVLGNELHNYSSFELRIHDLKRKQVHFANARIVDSLSIQTTTIQQRMEILGHLTPYDLAYSGNTDSLHIRLWRRSADPVPLPTEKDYPAVLMLVIKDWVLERQPRIIQISYLNGGMMISYPFDLTTRSFAKSYHSYLHNAKMISN